MQALWFLHNNNHTPAFLICFDVNDTFSKQKKKVVKRYKWKGLQAIIENLTSKVQRIFYITYSNQNYKKQWRLQNFPSW